MKIQDDTKITYILDSHEKRIGTLELALQGFLLARCVKSILRIFHDKINNAPKD